MFFTVSRLKQLVRQYRPYGLPYGQKTVSYFILKA